MCLRLGNVFFFILTTKWQCSNTKWTPTLSRISHKKRQRKNRSFLMLHPFFSLPPKKRQPLKKSLLCPKHNAFLLNQAKKTALTWKRTLTPLFSLSRITYRRAIRSSLEGLGGSHQIFIQLFFCSFVHNDWVIFLRSCNFPLGWEK